jgi:hypothetical protein
MQDNTGTLKVNATLTRVGKLRASQNNLNITKFAVADDGVNYSLLSDNLPTPNILIERTSLFDVWRDGASTVYNKIPTRRLFDINRNDITTRVFNFRPEFSRPSWRGTTQPSSRLVTTEVINNRHIVQRYRFSSKSNLNTLMFHTVTIKNNSLPSVALGLDANAEGDTQAVSELQEFSGNTINVLLHDNRYFDISFTQNYITSVSTIIPNVSFESVNTKPTQTLTGFNDIDSFSSAPKSLNLYFERIPELSFHIIYKGNYVTNNLSLDKYATKVTLLCTKTGLTQDIDLILQTSPQVQP